MIFKISKLLLKLRYRIEVKGYEEIIKGDDKGVLFLPNHPALIDPVILSTIIFKRFAPRPVADYSQANRKGFKKLISIVNPITIPDPKIAGPEGYKVIMDALNTAVSTLNEGKNMLIYPSGKMTFTGYEDIGGNCGVEYILKRVPDLRIVLVRTKGLWGSVFSRAYGKAPDVVSFVPTLIKALFLNAIFFIPKRDVLVEFHEPFDFPKNGDRKEINRYLENFYNEAFLPNTRYPYVRFSGKKPFIAPEPVYTVQKKNYDDISEDVRKKVLDKICEMAGVDKKDIKGDYEISKDLAIDSLSMIMFLTWTKKEFGFSKNYDLNGLDTVNDCFLAASGKI